MEKIISYTFWGTQIESDWLEWYRYVEKLFAKTGHTITHVAVKTDFSKTGRITRISKKKIEEIGKIKNNGNSFCVEVYSLPINYEIAAFDYDILCVRTECFISLVIKEQDSKHIGENDILGMKKFLDYKSGEVYSTLNNEVPLLYAFTNDSNNLSTYEFIKNI